MAVRRVAAFLWILFLISVLWPLTVYSPSPTFHSHQELVGMFKTLCDNHQSYASYDSVGTTYEGRDIWMFRLGNPNGGKVLWDGCLHGWEDMGSEVIYLFARWLLESGDPTAKRILDKNYVLFIPVVNMDSYERQNRNFEDCEWGVDLNRNFVRGWKSKAPNDFDYPGPYPASEPETQAMRQVFQRYRPHFYVNTHYGSSSELEYHSLNNPTVVASIKSRIEQISTERGVIPPPIRSYSESTEPGFAMNDAYDFGASAWLLATAGGPGCYEHTAHSYEDIVTTYFPKYLPILIAMCEACELGALVPPSASFTYYPTGNLSVFTDIRFSDATIDTDGAIVSWFWDFGDNTYSWNPGPTHRYSEAGTYIVRLTVTDDDGLTATKSHILTVLNLAPTANFNFSPENPVVGQWVNFTDKSTDPETKELSCFWDFGDNSTSTNNNSSHKYMKPGVYTVNLTVIDDENVGDSTSRFIEVTRAPTNHTVGVKAGDWMKFGVDASWSGTGTEPTWTKYEWVRMEIQNVSGFEVTALFLTHLKDDTEISSTLTWDLEYTEETWILPANLHEGDPLPIGANLTLNKTVTQIYVDTKRNVNLLNLTQAFGDSTAKTILWDQTSGILVEYYARGSSLTDTWELQYVAVETNMWFPTPLQVTAQLSYDTITQGGAVNVFVEVKDNTEAPLEEAIVTADIRELGVHFPLSDQGNGNYHGMIDTSDMEGSYEIVITAQKEGYKPIQTTQMLKVNVLSMQVTVQLSSTTVTPSKKVTVSVTVNDDMGNPVMGAEVKATIENLTILLNPEASKYIGSFEPSSLTKGTYPLTITVKKMGYKTAQSSEHLTIKSPRSSSLYVVAAITAISVLVILFLLRVRKSPLSNLSHQRGALTPQVLSRCYTSLGD